MRVGVIEAEDSVLGGGELVLEGEDLEWVYGKPGLSLSASIGS
jgi:hypothetical protein